MTGQRQDSLAAQMGTVVALAEVAGCRDAADWIKTCWSRRADFLDKASGDERLSETDRAEAARLSQVLNDAMAPTLAKVNGECGLKGRGGICRKPRGHGQRHRYSPPPLSPPHVKPEWEWESVTSVPIRSGSKTFTLKVGGPCSVLPGDLESKTRTTHGWVVTSIDTHPDGRVNVGVVQKKTGRSRTVPLARIEYRRPKKAAA